MGDVHAAAQALVDKLDLIHADPAYQSVWTLMAVRGGEYKGPDYAAELTALRQALSPQPVSGELRERIAIGLSAAANAAEEEHGEWTWMDLAAEILPLLNAGEGPAIWRCAIGDMIHIFDRALKPLRDSRRKAEREIGERLFAAMTPVFEASRGEGPETYEQANALGKRLHIAFAAAPEEMG